MTIDYSIEHSIEHVYTEQIGWALFATDDAIEIERVDEFMPETISDLHAEWLVHFLAADGDTSALRALKEISYSHINDAFKHVEPPTERSKP